MHVSIFALSDRAIHSIWNDLTVLELYGLFALEYR